jgi:hypothetical protein
MTSNISSKPIQQATKDNSATEQQGTKEKFWYGENRDKLCKFGKVHGENWAELIACSLATSLEIPRAKYIPAEFQVPGGDSIKCVVSQSFINRREGERLINANELLAKNVESYDQSITYKQRKYTFLSAVGLFKVIKCEGLYGYTPVQQFIGYLLFDVFIGNQDRHHENWGFVSSSSPLYLAPSFDHGSSLACRISDETRLKRMLSTDKGYQINSFITSAKSAMYGNTGKLLKLHELAKVCKYHYPKETGFWIEKIVYLQKSKIETIINTCPPKWMTNTEKKFTLSLLLANQLFLKSLQANV